MTDLQEIRDQTDEQLHNLLEDIDKEMFTLKNELAASRKIEKPHLLKEKRRIKARILTVFRERRGEGHGEK